ncbi:NAD(P)H nitroreductase [Streptosporangium violaceochromogenes]|nr:NAD(P)H nitroreductase [Streptosporangium violaceochromogenes]
MNTHTAQEITLAVHTAVEAALWAPSVHNTQPWSFAVSGDEISVRADADRRLRTADPGGRQMLISCGAALLNVRLALRTLGYEPVVRVLPDPDRPALLATVRPEPGPGADEHTRMLSTEIECRRTHRGEFSEMRVPERLLEALAEQAAAEGARLTPVGAAPAVRVLAALTAAAQEVQSQNQAFSLELLRWGRPPGSPRRDGVAIDAASPRRTDPHFAQRDYTAGRSWEGPAESGTGFAGVTALLTTPGDSREEWIAAGQALQRVLLHASAYGVGAAFHTQALEMRHLREFLRLELCSGEYPQMIMRLGFTVDDVPGTRRPLREVLEELA